MEKKSVNQASISSSTYLMHLFIGFYFIVLFTERIQSLIRSILDPSVQLFGSGFNRYVYVLTIVSLVGTLFYLMMNNRYLFVGIFTRRIDVHRKINLSSLCIAIGMILISGMVHTEYTIAPLQFVAYGALIIAIIIQAVQNHSQATRPIVLWISIAFLIAFSMSIPVVYQSSIEMATLFHILEAIFSIVLVALFTFMIYQVFCKDATDLLYIIPMVTILVLDGIILAMRWIEEINWFVLISLVVTSILFIVGAIIKKIVK